MNAAETVMREHAQTRLVTKLLEPTENRNADASGRKGTAMPVMSVAATRECVESDSLTVYQSRYVSKPRLARPGSTVLLGTRVKGRHTKTRRV